MIALVLFEIFLSRSSRSMLQVFGSTSTHLRSMLLARISPLVAVQVRGVVRISDPGGIPLHVDSAKQHHDIL